MAELLRIGNNSEDKSLYEQWALEPGTDPTDVYDRLGKAYEANELVRLRVSKTANGPLRDLYVNPAQCAWWDIRHTDRQQKVVVV